MTLTHCINSTLHDFHQFYLFDHHFKHHWTGHIRYIDNSVAVILNYMCVRYWIQIFKTNFIPWMLICVRISQIPLLLLTKCPDVMSFNCPQSGRPVSWCGQYKQTKWLMYKIYADHCQVMCLPVVKPGWSQVWDVLKIIKIIIIITSCRGYTTKTKTINNVPFAHFDKTICTQLNIPISKFSLQLSLNLHTHYIFTTSTTFQAHG